MGCPLPPGHVVPSDFQVHIMIIYIFCEFQHFTSYTIETIWFNAIECWYKNRCRKLQARKYQMGLYWTSELFLVTLKLQTLQQPRSKRIIYNCPFPTPKGYGDLINVPRLTPAYPTSWHCCLPSLEKNISDVRYSKT